MHLSAGPITNIYYGTCSWTELTLIESGTFYPKEVRSPARRLQHYASQFPLVEVDSTYYASPSERNAKLWAERTPPGFLFNIKAYGLLTQHRVATRTLSEEVRALLPKPAAVKERVDLSAVPPNGRDLLWSMHNEALRPLAESGKLGCVLLQFPPWLRNNKANREYLRALPDRLPYRITSVIGGVSNSLPRAPRGDGSARNPRSTAPLCSPAGSARRGSGAARTDGFRGALQARRAWHSRSRRGPR